MSKDGSMSACKTYCGTLSYMAPEVTDLAGGGGGGGGGGARAYEGTAADIWSLGGAGTLPQHELSSNKMAPITSD